MKKLIGALLGLVVGFFVGYLLFADNLSVSQVIMGSDTGVKLFDNIGNEFMENARLKVLISSVVGLLLGVVLTSFGKK